MSLRAHAFVFFAFFVAKLTATADVVVDGSSEIVLPANAPYATRLAAEELNCFLEKAIGTPLPVVNERTEGRTAIVLGGGGHAGRVPLPVGSRVPRDRYVVEAKGDAVCIAGNDDDVDDVEKAAALPDEAPWQPCFARGTLFGVYAFLERFAGVRMYFPGELGTCFAAGGTRLGASDSGMRRSCRSIFVPEGRIEESPAFSVRRYGYDDGPVAKELLGGMDETAFKRLNWYRLRMETAHLRCCHGAKTHCLSPDTWHAIYTNACSHFQFSVSHFPFSIFNFQFVFDAMPKDGFTWARHCRCGWCENNIPFSRTDTGFASDIVWRRTAELADRLRARFPEARVSQMSYIPYARIPTNDIPPNVDVFVARRGPWAEGTPIGGREKDEVAAWHAKLGRKVALWNYPDKVDCWNLEMKDIPQLAPRAWAGYYRAVAPHVTGAFAESESDRWIYNYLNYYVFSRLCWNPDADVEAILAEHHRLMFGEAADDMAEFFDTLERCWMKVVAKPYDTPLGPGVCEAPSEEELWTKIYSPEVLSRLKALVSSAEAKVAPGSLEARRIALFRREYFEPLRSRGTRDPAVADISTTCDTRHAASVPRSPFPVPHSPVVKIGLVADVHVGDSNDASDLRRALRLFDERKADVVIAAGDLTDLGLLSELREVAAAWNEVFSGNRRSDGQPVMRLFHYGDHDTELNWKARQREVLGKGRFADYIPRIGPDVAWRLAFGEPFEPVMRRTVKGCEFTAVHFLPSGMGTDPAKPPVCMGTDPANVGTDPAKAPIYVGTDPAKAWLHIYSKHRMYRGFFARPGSGDEVSWDDGSTLSVVTNVPNMVAVCGHGHISAENDTSFVALPGGSAAIAIPSLYYQIETWLPKPKGNHDSHQALFLVATPEGIVVERLDVRTGLKLGPDVVIKLKS